MKLLLVLLAIAGFYDAHYEYRMRQQCEQTTWEQARLAPILELRHQVAMAEAERWKPQISEMADQIAILEAEIRECRYGQ